MQKALIIQRSGVHGGRDFREGAPLDSTELNQHFTDGWRFVSATPFGVSIAGGGEHHSTTAVAAVLVIIEKPSS